MDEASPLGEPLGPIENLDSLLSESRIKAGSALDRLGWRTRLRLPEPLDFGIPSPRPLQVESILISGELNLPALAIVEAFDYVADINPLHAAVEPD